MKSDQKTVQKRVKEILDLKLLGALPQDILHHAEEQGWGVKKRMIQYYSAKADEMMAESVEKNRDRLIAFHFASRRALYARTMSVSDYKTALAALKDEADLIGLYPKEGRSNSGAGMNFNGSTTFQFGAVDAVRKALDDDASRELLGTLAGRLGGYDSDAGSASDSKPGQSGANGHAGQMDDGQAPHHPKHGTNGNGKAPH